MYVDITALRLGLERINELDNRYENMLGEERIRQTAEDKRINDERRRQSLETLRKSQETARRSAEDKRVTAEKEREVNEAQRQKDVVGKQDKLTAGDNIDITGVIISAVDTVYKKPPSEPISYIQGLQAELDSKVEPYGTNPVLNIAVISAGGSTTGMPNNTLILELE